MSFKKIDDIKDFSKLGFHFSDIEEKIKYKTQKRKNSKYSSIIKAYCS